MNYPNGVRKKRILKSKASSTLKYANRGMSLEEDINVTNDFYLETEQAVIHKKPTPIQVVHVNYPKRSAAVITEAYFKQASTTDYNGIYRGKHVDFEAKETKNKTSFPLANIHEHQIEHMHRILNNGGISFLIIRFKVLNETFFYPGKHLIHFWKEHMDGGRKSIPYEHIQEYGSLIPFKYQARVDYLSIIDKLYF